MFPPSFVDFWSSAVYFISDFVYSDNTGGPPSPRGGSSAVYDPNKNRMTIFGGWLNDAEPTDDVWVLENANGLGGTPQWTQLNPPGEQPSPRGNSSAVYDPNTNRMTIFAGQNIDLRDLNDVWVLENANGLGGTPTWMQLDPTGGPPSGRLDPSGVYDPSTNMMTIFGGLGANEYRNDLWVLTDANGVVSASLGEFRTAKAKRLESQGRGTVRIKGEFGSRVVHDLRTVTLRLDRGLFDRELGGKGELISKLDGTPLSGLELLPVRGAAQANWAIFRTPYGDVPEVQVTLRVSKVGGLNNKVPSADPYNITMEMEITNATIDIPASCERRRGRSRERVVTLGTQLTLVNEQDLALPINEQWECRLREDQLVLHDTAGRQPSAECKTIPGFCRAESP